MSDWTLDELVVAALAHGFDDDIRAFNGAASFVPVAARAQAPAPALVWPAAAVIRSSSSSRVSRPSAKCSRSRAVTSLTSAVAGTGTSMTARAQSRDRLVT